MLDSDSVSLSLQVESNVHKIVAHRRKYELSRKERELKKIELEKKRLAEAQVSIRNTTSSLWNRFVRLY